MSTYEELIASFSLISAVAGFLVAVPAIFGWLVLPLRSKLAKQHEKETESLKALSDELEIKNRRLVDLEMTSPNNFAKRFKAATTDHDKYEISVDFLSRLRAEINTAYTCLAKIGQRTSESVWALESAHLSALGSVAASNSSKSAVSLEREIWNLLDEKRHALLSEKISSPDVANRFMDSARAHQKSGNYQMAISLCSKSVDIFSQIFGPNSIHVGNCVGNLAQMYAEAGAFDVAEHLMHRAHSIIHSEDGERSKNYFAITGKLGSLYEKVGRLDQAKKYSDEAFRIAIKHFQEDKEVLANAHNNNGVMCVALEDFESGVKHYKTAINLGEAYFGKNSYTIGLWRNNLAGAQRSTGDLDASAENYRAAIEIAKILHPEGHPQSALWKSWSTRTLVLLGQFEGCVENLREAAEDIGSTVTASHPNMKIVYQDSLNVAQAMRSRGLDCPVPEEIKAQIEVSSSWQYFNVGEL